MLPARYLEPIILFHCFRLDNWRVVVLHSQTAIFSVILGPEKIKSGTPTIGKALLTPTAIWGG